jgi:hypothetical protein
VGRDTGGNLVELTIQQLIGIVAISIVGTLILYAFISAIYRGSEKDRVYENERREQHRQMFEFVFGVDRWHDRCKRNPNSIHARLGVIESQLNIVRKEDPPIF